MISVALALLVQNVSPEAVTGNSEAPGITVLGQKLRKLRLNLAMSDGGITGCRIAVSSGDKVIDGEACKASYACVRGGVRESQQLLKCIDTRITRVVDANYINQNEGRNSSAED